MIEKRFTYAALLTACILAMLPAAVHGMKKHERVEVEYELVKEEEEEEKKKITMLVPYDSDKILTLSTGLLPKHSKLNNLKENEGAKTLLPKNLSFSADFIQKQYIKFAQLFFNNESLKDLTPEVAIKSLAIATAFGYKDFETKLVAIIIQKIQQKYLRIQKKISYKQLLDSSIQSEKDHTIMKHCVDNLNTHVLFINKFSNTFLKKLKQQLEAALKGKKESITLKFLLLYAAGYESGSRKQKFVINAQYNPLYNKLNSQLQDVLKKSDYFTFEKPAPLIKQIKQKQLKQIKQKQRSYWATFVAASKATGGFFLRAWNYTKSWFWWVFRLGRKEPQPEKK